MQNPPRRRRDGNGSSRSHQQRYRPSPLDGLRPGQAAFKIVCHNSAVGGVIGPSGSIISQIRHETSCIVSCAEPAEGAEHRVFVVVGSATPDRRLLLRAAEEAQEAGEELISDAQEAVLRVLERMWEVSRVKWRGKTVGGGGGRDNEGFCGLLADGKQIGAVVGKGGRTINRMKSISGAHINILPAPPCASPDDQLIQITGSVLAVKRAIVVVTACLQRCSPFGSDPLPIPVRPIERSSSPTSSYDRHLEFFPNLSSKLPSLVHGDDEEREVSYRLLVSYNAAGGIIGTGGHVIRSLQNQTGASIQFAAPKTKFGDRVVMISAFETLECRCSPAQHAAELVFVRSIESEFEKAHSSPSLTDGTAVTARLLLCLEHVSFLVGLNGTIDAEVFKGATVRLKASEDSTADFVLEIGGRYENVRDSLSKFLGKLRGSVFPRDRIDIAAAGGSNGRVSDVTSSPTFASLKGSTTMTAAIEAPNATASLASPSKITELERCMRFLLPGKGPGGGSKETKPPQFHPEADKSASIASKTVATTRGNIQLGLTDSQTAGGSKATATDTENHPTNPKSGADHERKNAVSVANETFEVTISAELVDLVCGKNGSNLDNIRKISGAEVAVIDHRPGKSARIVVSGIRDEAKVAHSLLQASVLLAS